MPENWKKDLYEFQEKGGKSKTASSRAGAGRGSRVGAATSLTGMFAAG
jgi:hypothetical protein